MTERRFLRSLWLTALGLGFASAFVLAADEKDPKPKTFQEYYHSFKGNVDKHQDFKFTGPQAEQCVQFEPAGLHIKLPPGYAGDRPGTGVIAPFKIKGDFEITMGFAILQEPDTVDKGDPSTRLSLAIALDTPKENIATLSRTMTAHQGKIFVPWKRMWNSATGKGDPKTGRLDSTTAMTGRLRLVRTGSDLSYSAAEGADGEFNPLQEFPFGDADLRDIRLIASTGGAKYSFDAVVTDLRIRAESSPNLPATAEMPAAATPAAAPQAESKGWLVAAEVLGLGIVLAMALGLGVWLYLRQSRHANKTPAQVDVSEAPADADAVALPVSFSCACGKNLKARAELAGKKVKCSQCGQPVLVPDSKASNVSRLSS